LLLVFDDTKTQHLPVCNDRLPGNHQIRFSEYVTLHVVNASVHEHLGFLLGFHALGYGSEAESTGEVD
jgi:hypothetical protein